MAGGTLIPQTAFAYKYYIHCDDGAVIQVEFANKDEAKDVFNMLAGGRL